MKRRREKRKDSETLKTLDLQHSLLGCRVSTCALFPIVLAVGLTDVSAGEVQLSRGAKGSAC